MRLRARAFESTTTAVIEVWARQQVTFYFLSVLESLATDWAFDIEYLAGIEVISNLTILKLALAYATAKFYLIHEALEGSMWRLEDTLDSTLGTTRESF